MLLTPLKMVSELKNFTNLHSDIVKFCQESARTQHEIMNRVHIAKNMLSEGNSEETKEMLQDILDFMKGLNS
jgi:sensor histidine kinase regulating citrate/malate metabolism